MIKVNPKVIIGYYPNFKKAAINPLSLKFLPQNDSLKAANSKINSFKSFVKKELLPNQKIIKDNYSNYDLMNDLYTSNIFIHSDKGYTDSILNCICVLLNNQKDAYLLHLTPAKHKNPKDIYYMQKQIANFADNLSSNNQKCSAFLFGGEKNQSEKLHSDIVEVLNNKKISTSEVLFDKNNDPHSFYYDINKGIVLDDYKYCDLEDIKSDFEIVKIL